MPSQTQIRQQITQRIVDALQQNILPWRRPWKTMGGGLPKNVASGRRYNGINVPLLLMSALERGYQSQWWGTYQQWQEQGGQVRRGEKGTRIVLSRSVEKNAAEQDGDVKVDKFFLLRTFTVFNLDQVSGCAVEGLRPQKMDVVSPTKSDFEPAEQLIAATEADIRFGGDRAFYVRPTGGTLPDHDGGDYIQMPTKAQFGEQRDFYGTMFHELGHWTECRLGWSGSYAMGELVAEMTACFVANELGVPQSETLDNTTAYIKAWLQQMASDPKFIFQAASQASKATNHLLSFTQPEEAINDDSVIREQIAPAISAARSLVCT